MRRPVRWNWGDECLRQLGRSFGWKCLHKGKNSLLFIGFSHLFNLNNHHQIFSSVAKKTPNVQQRNWIIVGLAAVQSTPNCRLWPIFVKHVVDNTKWANALVLVSAISCIWNRFPEICEGNILMPHRLSFVEMKQRLFRFFRYLYSRRRGGRSRSRSRSPQRNKGRDRSRDRRRSRSRERRERSENRKGRY